MDIKNPFSGVQWSIINMRNSLIRQTYLQRACSWGKQDARIEIWQTLRFIGLGLTSQTAGIELLRHHITCDVILSKYVMVLNKQTN